MPVASNSAFAGTGFSCSRAVSQQMERFVGGTSVPMPLNNSRKGIAVETDPTKYGAPIRLA